MPFWKFSVFLASSIVTLEKLALASSQHKKLIVCFAKNSICEDESVLQHTKMHDWLAFGSLCLESREGYKAKLLLST